MNEQETYVRAVERRLAPLPRKIRRTLASELDRHLAAGLLRGRPPELTIARLGPAERVAAELAEAWLAAIDASRTARERMRLLATSALAPAVAGVLGFVAVMIANTYATYVQLVDGATLWRAVALNLPAIVYLAAPFVSFLAGAGALMALAVHTSAATYRRLAPRAATATALGALATAPALFAFHEAVVVPANRAVVATVYPALRPAPPVHRSAPTLSWSELSDRPDDRAAAWMRLAFPACTSGGMLLGLAWAARRGRRRLLSLRCSAPATPGPAARDPR